jgi:hypothetical protein
MKDLIKITRQILDDSDIVTTFNNIDRAMCDRLQEISR